MNTSHPAGPVAAAAVAARLDSADTLDALRLELTALADGWETTSPAVAARTLYDLEARAHVLSAGVRNADAAAAWAHLRCQVYVMESQSLIDLGRPRDAYQSADAALKLAAALHDPATQAHAETLAATVARQAHAPANPARLLTAACDRAGGSYGSAIARTWRAVIVARSGAVAGRQLMDAVTSAEAADLGTGRTGFALGGWDPVCRDAQLGAALAATGLRGPARERLDRAAAATGPGADGTLVAPRLHALVLIYRAQSAAAAGDLDEARQLVGQAFAAAAGLPSAQLAAGALRIAVRAEARGEDWSDIRATTDGIGLALSA